MAKKKEKNLSIISTLNNSEFVRAITSSGSSTLIRKSDLYPTANINTDGLMSAKFASRIREYTLSINEETDSGINHAGIIQVTCTGLTGSALVGVSTVNSNYVYVIYPGSGSIVFEEVLEKLCVFKKTSTGTFFIKNNTPYNISVTISLL